MQPIKIGTGAVFMYRTGGIPATCFAFTMKSAVDRVQLQRAVDTAMTRYPYFQCRAMERDGDYYLVDNPKPVRVSGELLPLGGSEANDHLLGVCGRGNEIIFSMHHGFCDGVGFTPFMKTVLYYYCCFRAEKSLIAPDVRKIDSTPVPGETLDPLDIELAAPDSPAAEKIKPFVLPETEESFERHYRWRLRFDGPAIHEFGHRYAAGISAVIALMMSEAISRIFPEEQCITAHLASDARAAIGAEESFMNCIDGIGIVYSDRIRRRELEMKLTAFCGTTLAEKQPAKVIPRFLKTKQLNQYLSRYSDLAAKRQMMKFTDRLTVNTFLVSYIGRMNLGEVEPFIEMAEVYGTGTNGLVMEVMSVNDSVTVSLMQNFSTDRYVRAFVRVCEDYGLTPAVEDIGEFTTPRCPVN